MRSAALQREPGSAYSSRISLAILTAATVGALAPFLNKAFCVDDPLFLWAARQIQKQPLDFYGCIVNWGGVPARMFQVAKNPPLASYYIAITTPLTGWSEPALHAAFLLPAVGAILGTWFLARSLCQQPIFAALMVLATPAFLVSSTNIMCDSSMLCLWTWAIALWIKGLDSADSRWAALAAVLIAAAALTKYFAISLIPLLAVYTLLRQRRPTWMLLWLAVPVGCLAGYQWWTRHQYGVGLLSDAAGYVRTFAKEPEVAAAGETATSKTVTALSFTGGSFITILLLAPWLWPKRGLAAIAIVVGIATVCAKAVVSERRLAALHAAGPFAWSQAVQMGLFTTCGLLVLWSVVSPLVRQPSADNWLLAVWVLGTLAFAGFVNWTCNVRSVLPLAPALAILVARQLEQRRARAAPATPSRGLRGPYCALALSAEIALMVGWADLCFADSDRTATQQIAAWLPHENVPPWIEGHWGFQYYMLAKGARDLNVGQPACEPADFVVIPTDNSNVKPLSNIRADLQHVIAIPVCPWLATMHSRPGAGFYSSRWGPFPFVFNPVDDQTYEIWCVRDVPSRAAVLGE